MSILAFPPLRSVITVQGRTVNAEGDVACTRALKDSLVVCPKGLQFSCGPVATGTPYPSLPDWIDRGGED